MAYKNYAVTIRNIHAFAMEVYNTLNDLNHPFMKEIFCFRERNYFTRRQQLFSENPSSVTYCVESFKYKAGQIWSSPHKLHKISLRRYTRL